MLEVYFDESGTQRRLRSLQWLAEGDAAPRPAARGRPRKRSPLQGLLQQEPRDRLNELLGRRCHALVRLAFEFCDTGVGKAGRESIGEVERSGALGADEELNGPRKRPIAGGVEPVAAKGPQVVQRSLGVGVHSC